MTTRNQVWVERVDGKIVRIFRSTKGPDWKRAMEAGTLHTCPKKDAVGEIRKQVWERCGGRCEYCSKPVTETGPLWKRFHMHEEIPKGSGGEVSLTNCKGICQNCHENDLRGHGNRKLRFTDSRTFEELLEE